MAHAKCLQRRNRFKFIFSPAFGILLVLFLFVLNFFAEVTSSFALHFGFGLVFAEVGRDIVFITLIVEDEDILAERLSEHTG